MNDIEILEEFIKYFEAEATSRKYRRNISITVGEDDIEAIENLIQRVKDLEEIEKEHKEENGRLRERTKELEGIYNTAYNIGKSYINIKWKSKIKEKMELLREDIQYSANPLSIDNSKYAIEVLQELLEESEK